MAEPLKNHFGIDVIDRIAADLSAVHDSFDSAAFRAAASKGFQDLELMDRGRHIAAAMAAYLPADRGDAIDIVAASFGPELDNSDPTSPGPASSETSPASNESDNPIATFFYLPHSFFIAEQGVEHFDQAMRANYEITKRFTAEFCVRSQLEANPEAAMALLDEWAGDDNVHVRRLVSEGTRPRLPWASRLRDFQRDPTPVIVLLEKLRDDPVEYVRRSVANNLNDIAKDHPEVVVEIAERWWRDADENRQRLVRHALRTLIKQGDPGALAVLGYGPDSPATVVAVSITPERVEIGGRVKIEISIENSSAAECGALVDLQVHFVKANGTTAPKVFKGKELSLAPGEVGRVRKTISVAQHTTRTHYRGEHAVEILINGAVHPAGSFDLI